MEENPLQKYVDAIDNPKEFVQPSMSPALAQYIVKALDYLAIAASTQPDLIEPKHHEMAESIMVDIICLAPEDE
jgi:hypothetical protein